ncbi:MAG TPA: cytochrome c oxidase subunit 3 [Acidimicrobiales bacterium]|nr:cytochrome c oxidase subunit 3 [Acidimicrobiales bacterium]
MASPTLALTAGGGAKRRGVLTLAMVFAVCGGAMLFAALLGAYLHMRRIVNPFPPKGVHIDEYWGNVMVGTMLMASATVEWGCSALRRGQRKEALAGFGVTLGLGLAFLNLLSFTSGHTSFDAVSHPYGLVVTALVMTLGIVVGIGVAIVALTLFRVAGRQLLEPDAEQPRASAIYWHFTTIAALAVWYTVIVLK